MARFILNPRVAIERYESLKQFGEVWYNLKTNPQVGGVLEKNTKAFFTVTGIGNLERLHNIKRAIVLVQGETRKEIEQMADNGVAGFIVDNERELGSVADLGTKIFLRVKMKEHTVYTGKHFVYGIDWHKAVELVKKTDVTGIHFHRKTQNIGEWSLASDLSPIISDLEGLVTEVNMGGGLPVEYHNSKPPIEPIFKEIEKLKNNLQEKGMKLILEPGRFIAAPAVKLETSVINKYEKNLVVDASIYNASMDTFLLNTRLPVEGEKPSGRQYLIKGMSPDSLDIFRYKVFFDDEKQIGDSIIFLNAGAYNFHTEFADLPRIPTEI